MGNWYSKPMESEIPHSKILEMKDSGKFLAWNFSPFDFRETGYEDVIDEIKKYRAVDYLAEKDEEKREEMVEAVLKIYRSKNILPIQYYSEGGICDEIEKCISYDAKFDGNTVNCGAGVGTSLCNFLFPNLFNTPSQHDLGKTNARSLYEKFYNDEYLKRAIKFCFSYKDGCPVPTAVMGGLRLVGSAPTNFRPMNAKAVYERFCPKGGVVYDYCCVSGNTEYFNGEEWVRIDKYQEGDRVLQYEVLNGEGVANLVYPEEYIKYSSDAPFFEYFDDFCVTGNHNIPCIVESEGRDDGSGVDLIPLEDLMKSGREYAHIPGSCVYGCEDDKSDFRLVIDISYYARTREFSDFCDPYEVGSYCKEDEYGYMCFTDKVFTLSLTERRALLKALGINVKSKEPLNSFKSKSMRESICNIINMSYSGVYAWSSRSEGIFIDKYLRLGVSNVNRVSQDIADIDELGFDPKLKYCFTVPSHMLVLRYNGKIFITGNCGFGGRMLGALSSKNNYKYVGTDPCTETMCHLHELGEYIELVTGRTDSYELHCCGSEEFIGKPNSVDFAFSSPPYFNLEVYSDEPTQCYNKYPKLDDWLEGYVRATIKNIYRMLKPGRVYAVNIADFTAGGEVAYVDEWIHLSWLEGMPLFDTVYLGVNARAGSKEQSAGEAKKENILIFKKPL